jgi:hypothetical protein
MTRSSPSHMDPCPCDQHVSSSSIPILTSRLTTKMHDGALDLPKGVCLKRGIQTKGDVHYTFKLGRYAIIASTFTLFSRLLFEQPLLLSQLLLSSSCHLSPANGKRRKQSVLNAIVGNVPIEKNGNIRKGFRVGNFLLSRIRQREISGRRRRRPTTKSDFFLDTPKRLLLPFSALVFRLGAADDIFLGFTRDGNRIASYSLPMPSHQTTKVIHPLLFRFHHFTTDLFSADRKHYTKWRRHCVCLSHRVADPSRALETQYVGTSEMGLDPTEMLEAESSNDIVNTPVEILENGDCTVVIATKYNDDMRGNIEQSWSQGHVYNEEIAYFSIFLSPGSMEASSRSVHICWFSLITSSFPVGASPLCPESAQVVLTAPSQPSAHDSCAGALQVDHMLAVKNQNGLHLFSLKTPCVALRGGPPSISSQEKAKSVDLSSQIASQKTNLLPAHDNEVKKRHIFGLDTDEHKVRTFPSNPRWFHPCEPASKIYYLSQVANSGEELYVCEGSPPPPLHENASSSSFVQMWGQQMVFHLENWLMLNLKRIVPSSLKISKLLDHEHKLMPFADREWIFVSSISLISCHALSGSYIIGLAIAVNTLTGETAILRAFTRKGSAGHQQMRSLCHDFASRMHCQFAPSLTGSRKQRPPSHRNACSYHSSQAHVLSNRNVLKGVSMKILENPKMPIGISM